MPLNLNYLYGNEAEQFSFYRIPKTLFTDQHYQNVSIEAKVLYGLLLDRISLSVRSGWMDDEGRIFIYFTQEEAMAAMGCGKDKATKLFRELDQTGIGLIERRKQGQGRPARIYVKNFVLPLEPDQAPPSVPQTAEKEESRPPTEAAVQSAEKTRSESRQSSGQDTVFSAAIKTDKNKTDWNDTESSSTPLPPASSRWQQTPGPTPNRQGQLEAYRTVIRENISYDILLRDYGCDRELLDGCVEMMAEVCASAKETIRVNQEDMPVELVRSRFLKLDMTHIAYVLDYLSQNTTPVGNIRGYMLSMLYNAPMTMGQYYAAQVNCDIARRREAGA